MTKMKKEEVKEEEVEAKYPYSATGEKEAYMGIPLRLVLRFASNIILTVGSRITMRDVWYWIKENGQTVEIFKKKTDDTPYMITHLSNLIIYPSE